jgi:uncharacterized protein
MKQGVFAFMAVIVFIFAQAGYGACDPCKCGSGGGLPPPPECVHRFIGPMDQPYATNPCAGVDGWKAALCDFAKTKLMHSAWGYEHSLRDYTLAMELARAEGIVVDEEVIFAAAMLHDMGGFAPYAQPGVDHALRSTQVADSILAPSGFPMAKADSVKAAILNHSYYDPERPTSPEGIVLHDADGLDFLGGVSAMRILSIAGKEKFIPDVASAIKLLYTLKSDVPSAIYGGTPTRNMLRQRVKELADFLGSVERETYGFGIPATH